MFSIIDDPRLGKHLVTGRNLQQNHAQRGAVICCNQLGVKGE